MMKITLLYAGILGIILIVLTVRVVAVVRAKADVIYGDGGNTNLTPIVRGHGNFIEFVPIALILMALLESNGASSGFLHGLGIALVAGRIIHPFGLHPTEAKRVPRFIGASLTWLMIIVASIAAIWTGVQ